MNLVCKADGEQQIAYGEVYAPNRPDAQNEYMTKDEIRKMAHEFIRSGRMGFIDLMHENKVIKGASVVESFVAADDSTDYIPGSWVVGVHITHKGVWDRIKKGEINGFSLEAFVTRHDRRVQIEVPPVVTGLTTKAETSDGHQHHIYITYDDRGNFKGGVTDFVNGHMHKIVAGTVTEKADGHTHRFSSVDDVEILSEDDDEDS